MLYIPVKHYVPLKAIEWDIIGRLLLGENNKEIARAVGLQDVTVKLYVHRMLRKVRVFDRLQLALWAIRVGQREIGEA